MPRIAGVNHQDAVRAFGRAGFQIIRQGKHIVMSDGTRQITIPRHNPIKAFTMGGIVQEAGLTPDQFRALLKDTTQRKHEPNERSVRKPVMSQVKTVAEWMAERSLGAAELVEATGLDKRVVEAIVHGRYTPSPAQRQRLAAALGVSPDEIAWGHRAQVSHVQGHGPQFGRSP